MNFHLEFIYQETKMVATLKTNTAVDLKRAQF